MGVYNSLRSVAYWFGYLRGVFYEWGYAVRDVFLIGAYVTSWLYVVSGFFGGVENDVDDLAGNWLNFYNWLTDNLSISGVLATLLSYADDLISFIQFPIEWIRDAIAEHFPGLMTFIDDPVTYVLELFYQYTGLSYNFIHQPFEVVEGWINEVLGELQELRLHPRAWIIGKINDVLPSFWTFIYNPIAWVVDRLEDAFPFAIEFFRDPDGFLNDKIMDMLEEAGHRYLSRLIKLAERVLQQIF